MGRPAKRAEAEGAPLPATRRFVPISYRIDDAAEMIGLSPARVWELIAEGAIVSRKLGRASVIMHDDLYAFVRDSPVAPASRKVAQ